MHTRRTSLTVALALTLALGLLPAGAGAGGHAPAPGTVVASGLASPRGLVVAVDGTLYVAEAGTGGEEPLAQVPGATRGATGRVTRVAPGGAATVVADGLPSYLGSGYGGPAGLVLAGDALWLAIGGPAQVTTQVAPFPLDGAVARIDPRTGAVAKVADVLAHERAHNPGGFAVESNLYGLALGGDGNLYVADAGGNALYRVDPQTGALTLVTVFAGLPAPRANPGRGGREEYDPVPTGVAAGPDGALYVGLLLGGPPTPGATKVVRVAPDGAVSDAATGLTAVVAVAFGPDGRLYVAELTPGRDTTTQPPTSLPGRVLRVLAGGATEVVADGLAFPTGLAFDRAGNLFVALSPTIAGAPPPGPPQGRVLRFDGVAPAATPGLPSTGGGHAAGQRGATPALAVALLAGCALGGGRLLRRRGRSGRA